MNRVGPTTPTLPCDWSETSSEAHRPRSHRMKDVIIIVSLIHFVLILILILSSLVHNKSWKIYSRTDMSFKILRQLARKL